MVVRGAAAAVALIAVSAAIGAGINRLLTGSAEAEPKICSPGASLAAKLTVSLLPYRALEMDGRCSDAAYLHIVLRPDPQH
jgi:hypothetical protein